MKLYPLNGGGIRAYASDLIIDPEGDAAYLLSISGYQSAVKGIVGSFLEGYGLSLDVEQTIIDFKRSSFEYKAQTKSLPSGMAHSIIYPKISLGKPDEEDNDRFFVFTNTPEEAYELFFRHLDQRLEIPLHPSWTTWLWSTFMNKDEWFLKLETLAGNYFGYYFFFDSKVLEDLISQAIKEKTPEIINCMAWKGDPDDDSTQKISK